MVPPLTPGIFSYLLLLRHVSGEKHGIIGFGRSLYEDACSLACHDSLSSLYLSCTTFPEHHDMSGMHDGMDMDMDMDMEMMGMTSEECRTSNVPWLQTMAYCIQRECGARGYTMEHQARCFSTHAVAGASEPTFHSCLPNTVPTVELSENATWLNTTSLANRDLYYATYGTLTEFAKSEYIHTKYSMILYLIVIGTCLAWGVGIQLSSAFPRTHSRLVNSTLGKRFRQYISLPASFGSRHLEPLPLNLGYVPSRALNICIGIYVALNVILSCVSFGSFQPNVYFPSTRFELCEYVGNRTGMLSLVNISIAILFAGRNNILIAITGWGQTTFLTLHRWAARVATLQAIVHSGVYTLQYVDPGYEGAASYAEKAAEPFYWWGIIGTIALSLATAFAILPLRISLYEAFLIVHIILIILSLVACWYHLVPHFGFKYGYEVWLYISFAFWSADRLARLARIVYYNRLGDAKAIVQAIPGCNILHVTVFPRVARGIGPGQHTFLYFAGLGRFWESHPFSIAAWETEAAHDRQTSSSSSRFAAASSSPPTPKGHDVYSTAKELGAATQPPSTTTAAPRHSESRNYNNVSFQLLIRAHSGMTATLGRYLASPAAAGSRVEVSIYTEGYYAGHHATLRPLFTADTVLCLVGGLGITNALGFVQEYVAGSSPAGDGEPAARRRGAMMGRARRFVLAWSAKEAAFIDFVRENFLADAHGVECSFWYTGPSPRDGAAAAEKWESSVGGEVKGAERPVPLTTTTVGRMNIESVIRSSLEAGRQTTVLVCGPGRMADEARKQVVKCVGDGFSVDLVEEAFAW